MAHESGIDPATTFGELISSEDGLYRLAESGIAGALVGTAIGGATGHYGGKSKVQETLETIQKEPETILEGAGIDTSGDVKVGDLLKEQQQETKDTSEQLKQQVFNLDRSRLALLGTIEQRSNGVPVTSDLGKSLAGVPTPELVSQVKSLEKEISKLNKDAKNLEGTVTEIASQRGTLLADTDMAESLSSLLLERRQSGDLNRRDAARKDLMRYANQQRLNRERAAEAKKPVEVPPVVLTPEEEFQGYQPELPGEADRRAQTALDETKKRRDRIAAELDQIEQAKAMKAPPVETVTDRVKTRQDVVKNLINHFTDDLLFEEGTNNIAKPKEWKGPVSWTNVTPAEKAEAKARVLKKAEAKVKENPTTLKGKQEVKKAKNTIEKINKVVPITEAPSQLLGNTDVSNFMEENTGIDNTVEDTEIAKREADLQAKNQQEQQAILESGEAANNVKGWAGITTKSGGADVKIYQKDNATIVKLESAEAIKGNTKTPWKLVINDDDARDDRGYFKTLKDAQEAYNSKQTSEEFYEGTKKESKATIRGKQVFNLAQKKLLSDLGDTGVNKIVSKALNKTGSNNDALSKDAAIDGVYDGIKTFKGDKGKLDTFLIGKAIGAIKDAKKKLGMEVQDINTEVDEGTNQQGTLDSATRSQVKNEAITVVKKEKKVEEPPPPVKKVQLSKAEQDKLMERINKRKVTRSQQQMRDESNTKSLEDMADDLLKGEENLSEVNEEVSDGYRVQRVMDTDSKYSTARLPSDPKLRKAIIDKINKSVNKLELTDTEKAFWEQAMKRRSDGPVRKMTFTPSEQESWLRLTQRDSLFNSQERPGEEATVSAKDKALREIAKDLAKNAGDAFNNTHKSLDMPTSKRGELYKKPSSKAEEIAFKIRQAKKSVPAALEAAKKMKVVSSEEALKNDVIDLLEVQNLEYQQMKEEFDASYPNALTLLQVAASDPNAGVAGKLAKFLMNTIDHKQLEKIDVSMGDSNARTSDNNIVLRGNSWPSTWVHEVVHTITIDQMEQNSEAGRKIRKEVDRMMEVAKKEAIKSGFVSSDVMSKINKLNTSNDWSSNMTKDDRHAYGFLNRKEFLSEAFSNMDFRNFLKKTKYPGMRARSLWQAFRKLLGDIFHAKTPEEMTLLDAIITFVPDIAATPVTGQVLKTSNLKFTDESVDSPTKKTRADQLKVMKENAKSNKPGEIVKNFYEKTKDTLRDAGKSLTERLRKIDNYLIRPIRKMEFGILNDNRKYQDKIEDFVTAYKKMGSDDKLMFDLFLLNNDEADVTERKALLRKYKMTEAFNKVEEVLKEIHKKKDDVGLNHYGAIPDYFPRRVTDLQGLLQAMKGDETYNIIQSEIDSLGEDATDADKEMVIQRMINTGRFPSIALKKPSSSKQRTIAKVSSEWKHFYENPVDTLISHIYESNEAIYARKLFGDVTRKKRVQERDKLYKELESPDLKGRKREAKFAKLQSLELTLENMDADYEAGISQLLAERGKDLTPQEAADVVRIIRARLNQKGMQGALASIRNFSLMSVLGNPTSAITQIGDLGFSIYQYGPTATVKALLGDKLISTKDLDLSHSMKEFQQNGTARWLDITLKWSGLKWMDTVGKTTTMNAAIINAKKMTEESFVKKYSHILQEDSAKTYQDLKANKNTELTRFFAFNELSNMQPVSLSEMPLMYQGAGNGRIFYMLKSFNIKAINTIYRESVHAWRIADNKADKLKAGYNVGKLVLLLTMAGATADELKDLLLGRDAGTLSDNIHNNVLKLAFLSRYTLEQGSAKGLAKTFLQDILIPPVGLIDDPLYDISKIIGGEYSERTVRDLPWGKLPYEWLSVEAHSKDMSRLKQQIIDEYKEGSSFSSVRGDLNKYNAWARKNKESLITFSTLGTARSRYRKENS